MEKFDLPERWKWGKLGDKEVLSEIHPGFACGKKDVDGGVPHLRMNNISRDGFLDMTLVRRIPIFIAEKANKWLEVGDVVFNNTNSTELVGKSIIFAGWSERCTFSNHMTRLRCNKKTLTTEWLYFSLRELWLSGFFAANCTEFIGQSAFNKDKLVEIEIPIPPVDQQRRIVARIEELTRRVEEARRLRKDAVKEAEGFPSSLLNTLFALAEERNWPKRNLSQISTIIMGSSPKGNFYNRDAKGYPLLNGPTEFGERHPTPVQWTTNASRFCETGDILFCVRGSTTGRMNWADRKYCIGRGLAAIRSDKSKVLPELVYGFIQTQSQAILHKGEGGVFPNFNKDQIEEMELPLPSLEEQRHIVEYLNSLQSKVEHLNHLQLETEAELEKFTPALLAKAFKGEL